MKAPARLLPVAYGIASQLSLGGRSFVEGLEEAEQLAAYSKAQAKRRRDASQRGKIDRTIPARLRLELADKAIEIHNLRERLLESCRVNIELSDRIRVLEMKERALRRAEAFELSLDAALNRGELTAECKRDLSARLAAIAAEDRDQRKNWGS